MRVSVAGLGGGGFSTLGLSAGRSEGEAADLVRQALDCGVNFIDTARAYGTEGVVGRAVAGRRQEVVLSTKAQITQGDGLRPAAAVVADLDESLRQLRVEQVDIFHLHGVPPWAYRAAVAEIVPVLQEQRQRGKFRFLGITEIPPNDPAHEMLQQGVVAGCFDVVMVAFHMLHQQAREKVIGPARARGIGVLNMFAVRLLFSQAGRLRRVVRELVGAGKLPQALADKQQPLDFLLHADGAASIVEAAYRFCRHEPGVDVVLFGTGRVEHAQANIAALLKGPLPQADRRRLRALFGDLVGVGLDAPGQRS